MVVVYSIDTIVAAVDWGVLVCEHEERRGCYFWFGRVRGAAGFARGCLAAVSCVFARMAFHDLKARNLNVRLMPSRVKKRIQ